MTPRQMETKEALTETQRAVLQRLREFGFDALADLAQDHWSQGRPLPGVRQIPEPGNRRDNTYYELLEDFDRANEQAGS
jgi:hypothetical protein